MALRIDQLIDLTRSTLPNLDQGNITNLMASDRRHEAWDRILRRKNVGIRGGTSIKNNLLFNDNGAAKWTALYDEDTTSSADGVEITDTPFRHLVTSWSIDRREDALNSGNPALEIIPLVKIKRAQGMMSQVKKFEAAFWTKPVDSSDQLQMWGLQNWVVASDVEATDGVYPNNGFNGMNAAGFSAGPGGLDSSLAKYANWRNYTDVYDNVSKDDLIKKIRRAFQMCAFESPMDIEDFRKAMGRGNQYMGYTTYNVVSEVEDRLEDQNDNLGNDVAKFDGVATIKRCKIIAVPQLENDDDLVDPFYGINWALLYIAFKRGWLLNETEPEKDPNRHNVMTVFQDTMMNLTCVDRRGLFVIKKRAA